LTALRALGIILEIIELFTSAVKTGAKAAREAEGDCRERATKMRGRRHPTVPQILK